jgi:branched-chain amino acid transport system ATP-binding protein
MFVMSAEGDNPGTAPDAPPRALLVVRGLHARYGASHVLQGVDLEVHRGEIVVLLGRNGAGRSTLLKSIMGELRADTGWEGPPAEGSVLFKGQSIARLPPHHRARLGLGYVPENRDIFPRLSVRDNLRLGMKGNRPAPGWGIAEVWARFPLLAERADTPGGALSGGEQQLLALARCLVGGPDLVMVDEPTEGLAPAMVRTVAELLAAIAAEGRAVLLVEQKLEVALDISHRVVLMGHGRAVFAGTPAQLREDEALRRRWLELG